jgi:hypothetical protein
MPTSITDGAFDRPRQPDADTSDAGLPDRLDWDAYLEMPPPRRSGTIKVRLSFRGRGKPILPADPEALDNATRRDAR